MINMFKKTLTILLISGLFSSIFLFNTGIVDADVTYSITFEDSTVTDTTVTGSNYLVTGLDGCQVDDSPVYAGSRSWTMPDSTTDDIFFVNFTDDYINFISFYFRDTDANMHFWVYGYNADDTLIVKLRYTANYDFECYDHESTVTDIIEDYSLSTWGYVEVTISSSDEISYYTIDDGNYKNVSDTPASIDSDYNISYLKVVGIQDGTGVIHFDNVIFGYSEETPSGSSTYGSLTGYSSTCDIDTAIVEKYYTSKYIEVVWGIGSSDDIQYKAIDLYVHNSQISKISSTLSDYSMYLEGYFMGSPTYLIPQGSYYILRWYFETPQTFADSVFLGLEFYCSASYTVGGNSYHWIPVCNYDGNFWHHSVDGWFGDNIEGNDGSTASTHSLWLCVYFNFAQSNPDYDDSIGVVQASNTDIDEFYEWSNINIIGTLSTLVPHTYLQLNHDGSRYEGQIFGGLGADISLIGRYDFLFSFNSFGYDFDGSWNATLVRSGSVVDSYNFTIINRTSSDTKAHVSSYPNPQSVNSPIQITYLYDATYFDNLDCQLWVSHDTLFSQSIDTALKTHISGNGNYTYYHDTEETIYFMLVIYDNGIYSPIAMSPPQIIGNPSLNDIKVTPEKITITDDSPIGHYRVYGSHSKAGHWVRIDLNDGSIGWQDVSFDPLFSFDNVAISKGGIYIFTLEYLADNGTWVTLDTATLTVIDHTSVAGGGGGAFYENNAMIGAFVTLIFTIVGMLAPSLIVMALAKSGSTIILPPLINVSSGAITFLVFVAIGFIHYLYLVALLIIIGIVGLFYVYNEMYRSSA